MVGGVNFARLMLGMLLPTLAAPLCAEPPLVVLVRHAEKAAEPGADPGLSPAGQARAQALQAALGFAGIGVVVTTQYRRTRETAQPVAERLKLVPTVVEARRGEDAAVHIADLVAAVRQQTKPVLVVGHSNTVTALVAALGGPVLPELCESSFGHLFVLSPAGERGGVVQARYGQSDPAPTPGCL